VDTVALADGLARLLSVAAIYPAGHVRVMEAADPVLAQLRKSRGEFDGLGLELQNGALMVDGRIVPERSGPIQRLHQDLDGLGVTRLEIRRDARLEDLLALGKFLRSHAQAPVEGRAFQQPELTGLPDTVRMVQRDVGVPTFDESERRTEEAGTGGGGGPGDEEPPETTPERELLRTLLRDALRAFASDGASATLPAGARAPKTREDAVRALHEAVRRMLDQYVPGAEVTASAAAILDEAERLLPEVAPGFDPTPVLEALRQAIDKHLRDPFRRETAAVFDVDTPEGTDRDPLLELNELVGSLKGLDSGEPFGQALVVDPPEQLTILLHVMREQPSHAVMVAVGRRLESCLTDALGTRGNAVLQGWLGDVLRKEEPRSLDRMLPLVAGPLRRANPAAFAGLLVHACRGADAAVLDGAWPHAANELLLGVEGAQGGLEDDLIALVARLPVARRGAAMTRLASLSAVAGRAVSRRAFSPPRSALYPFYEAMLVELRFAEVAGLVMDAFQQDPPPYPAAGALTMLRTRDPQCRELLLSLLRYPAAANTAPMRKRAVDIVVGALTRLPKTRRKEEWVPGAIRALWALPSPEAEAIVKEIEGNASLAFWKAWPPACRQAAEAVRALWLGASASQSGAGGEGGKR
jgi:hypothetical protein